MEQRLPDDAPAVVEIWDAAGRQIYKQVQAFGANRKLNMQPGTLVPGMYLLKLTDSKNNRYDFRFVMR